MFGDVMLWHGVADALGRQPREALWSAEAPETLLARLWREPPMCTSESRAIRIARRRPTAPPG